VVPEFDSASPFAAFLHRVPESNAWLQEFRARGASRFAEVGIPSNRHEEWRFTPLGGIAAVEWQPIQSPGAVTATQLAQFQFGARNWPTIVLVDGHFSPELSRLSGIPAGVTVASITAAIEAGNELITNRLGTVVGVDHTPFAALNAAAFTGGLFMHLPRNVTMTTPVHLIHVSTDHAVGAAMHSRSLIVVDEGATGTLIESYVAMTSGSYVTNAVVEIVLAANSRLEHVRNQQESEQSFHLAFTQADQQRDSHYRSFALSLGGKLARHNLDANHQGSNVESLLYGLYVTRNDQLSDTHSAIHHNHPNCNSWEVYKGVLGDRSRGVFNGKVLVAPEAQKTDAKQTNRNLLLSDQAKVDTKPQLEIFADDVRCTHGATVGKLNELQRYYLRTRGIGGKQAERLLIWAFAAEVMVDIAEESVRKELEKLVRSRLEAMT
jgi:Fe-S cluster assembly protein SufD